MPSTNDLITWDGTQWVVVSLVQPSNLGTGSGITTKFLRGDSTWQTIAGGGDALVANPLSQFAATTSAQLAGVISDETGSGALVFATSPSLVTPLLGVPTSGTLTNCTGTASGLTAGAATALATGRTIGGVSFDGTANIVPQTIESANETADTTCFLLFITASGTQSLQPKNNATLTFNSSTSTLAATNLTGTLTTASQTAITGVGTITTGTWSATTVAVDKGGTGQTSYTNGQLLIGNTTGNTLDKGTLTAPAAGITITSGGGSITFALANDLSALEAMSGTGLVARTASETYAQRTLTGGGGVTVANGDGVSGNPTLGVSALRTLWVPAAAMRPSSTGGCAALALVAVAANQPDVSSLDFDSSTAEYAQFSVRFPKGWDEGTVTACFHWSHAATATNFGVRWGIQGVALSDDDAIGTAYGTAQEVTDTGGTTNDLYVSPTTSAVTIAGTPAVGDQVFFRVYRDPANTGDTMAIDARLMGVTLFFTINTLDDA